MGLSISAAFTSMTGQHIHYRYGHERKDPASQPFFPILNPAHFCGSCWSVLRDKKKWLRQAHFRGGPWGKFAFCTPASASLYLILCYMCYVISGLAHAYAMLCYAYAVQ